MARTPEGSPAPADGSLSEVALETLSSADFGVYVHVPFCTTRCGYCDFTTYTPSELEGTGTDISSWLEGVRRELDLADRVLGGRPPVRTVFLGGGTPSLLSPAQVEQVLQWVGAAPGAEVTMEANPESTTAESLAGYAAAGVNRMSFGMQSAASHVLKALQRKHSPGRVAEVVGWARDAGIARISVDLIYGAHGETAEDWQESLDAAVALDIDHLSAYALVVEDGTALGREVRSGVVPAPDDDVLADRYEVAERVLVDAGFSWYEISSWARSPEQECAHNRLYWSPTGAWWGVGPGAHSHVGGTRWWNVKNPRTWRELLAAGGSPAAGRDVLSADARELERIMLGLRVREGLAAEGLRTGDLVDRGLIVHSGGRISLTLEGRLLADAVVRQLTS